MLPTPGQDNFARPAQNVRFSKGQNFLPAANFAITGRKSSQEKAKPRDEGEKFRYQGHETIGMNCKDDTNISLIFNILHFLGGWLW
jgi:hypothetical protein